MSGVTPIPRALLPHTATIEERDTSSRYDGVYHEPVTYQYVRLEPAESMRMAGYQLAPQTTGILFIDAVTTKPGVKPGEGARVVCEGITGYVDTVSTFYAFGTKPHHWEVHLRG